MIEKQYDKVDLKIFDTRAEMGRVAAEEAAECMRKLLAEEEEINCIFAAAPSQSEFLEALCQQPGIDWSRVNGYHMDEYVGLPLGHPKSFNHFLSEAIFNKVPFKSVHLIDGSRPVDEVVADYGAQLDAAPTHITFMGIGENGHIAFNDPPVADFEDKVPIKKVQLDLVCRQQQVHDKCFDTLADVPEYALTVTCLLYTSFAAWVAAKKELPAIVEEPGMESCEIHSMSMEFLTAEDVYKRQVVPTIDGKVQYTVPEGTQSGTTFRPVSYTHLNWDCWNSRTRRRAGCPVQKGTAITLTICWTLRSNSARASEKRWMRSFGRWITIPRSWPKAQRGRWRTGRVTPWWQPRPRARTCASRTLR